MIGSVFAGLSLSMVCATRMTAGRSAESRNGIILRKLIEATPGVASNFFCTLGVQAAVAFEAQIDVGRQHLHEPLIHRAAEAPHHHRHGDHQARARDDAAERDRGLRRRAPQPFQREIGGRGEAPEALQRRQQQAREQRHRGDAAGEQQRDREIAEQRKLADRGQEGRGGSGREQTEGEPRMRPRFRIGRVAHVLERDRGLRARHFACGEQAAHESRADAEHEERQRRPGRECELRARAAEIAAAEIAAQKAQARIGDDEPDREANDGADRADDGAFGQHLRDKTAAIDAEDAEQRELRAAPRNRKRLRRVDQERAGEQRHQRQHVEIDAVGARETVGAACFGLLTDELGIGRQQRRDGCAHARRVHAGREFQVDAVQPSERIEPPLRIGDVHDGDALILLDGGKRA